MSFSDSYVDDLQKEQEERYKRNIRKKPKEFRSSLKLQVEGMLATHSDYSCSKKLRMKLQDFTNELKLHCGISPNSTYNNKQELSSMEKLKKLVRLVTSFKDSVHCETSGNSSDGISLQNIITQTMIEWASTEIEDLKLIEEVFSLLYRQFNEVQEVVQALNKTYVLEVTKAPLTGKPNFDIQAFCTALGSLRLLLRVGMSKKEENLLKDSLKYND